MEQVTRLRIATRMGEVAAWVTFFLKFCGMIEPEMMKTALAEASGWKECCYMEKYWLDGVMGVVVGDALGCPVQFMERNEIANRA